ncbi:MAG: Gfo/Idh/MocA family oxidoreductase [Planctomycetes bacterium]|jgi:predicted dehydrogenase|nr:Gfo/Idh/MocA family oxidoreductase [Planctomycetota bacterium]
MSKKIRCGVIGLGMGTGHVKGYQSHPQAEVVAVADTNPDRLEQRAEEFGVEGRYTDAKTMLKDETLDVVSVVTPNTFHKPLTIAALKAGCHVLCDKPMAMNAREAQAMLDASKKARKRLMINFSYRFSPQSQALKTLVAEGELGDIYYGQTVWHRRRGIPGFGGWFGTKALSGGGPLIDLGVHRLDLALWLMGYPKPTYVMGGTYNPIATRFARAAKKTYDVEDLAVGMIRFANGAMLEIEASWAVNIRQRELQYTRLLGTDAGLKQYNINETYDYEAEVYLEKHGTQYDMKVHPPVPGCQSSYYHFIDSIVNDQPHIATGEEGVTVMKLLDAIYTSASTGKPVQIRQ